jgi:hypothetical protein
MLGSRLILLASIEEVARLESSGCTVQALHNQVPKRMQDTNGRLGGASPPAGMTLRASMGTTPHCPSKLRP